MSTVRTAPLATAPADFELVADYFEGRIDLRAFRAHHQHYRVLSANPLVLEPEQGAYVYVEKFGTVVFWNCDQRVVRAFHDDLRGLNGLGELVEGVRDQLTVHVGGEDDRVGFSEVWVRDLTLGKLKIISLALAQSVALDHFEGAVRDAMASFEPVVRELARGGRLTLRHRHALQLVGFALQVRAAVLENLTLFDDPPETWESEGLAHLDSELYDQFDLEERLSAIQQKLAYLSDAGARVMDVLTTRKNHRLEWVIIVLIAVEVVAFFYKEILGLLGVR